MTDKIVDLGARREPVLYSVHFEHKFGGEMSIWFEGLATPPSTRSKQSLLESLRVAAKLLAESIAQDEQQEKDGHG
jgi:hypothetical protein